MSSRLSDGCVGGGSVGGGGCGGSGSVVGGSCGGGGVLFF